MDSDCSAASLWVQDQWSDSVKGKDLPAIWTFPKAFSGLKDVTVCAGTTLFYLSVGSRADGRDSENSPKQP